MNRLSMRILVWFHGGVLVLLLLWASVGNWAAERQWQAVVAPLRQALMQEFPPRSADENAIQVQKLATNLGLSLAPRNLPPSNSSASLPLIEQFLRRVFFSSIESLIRVRTFPESVQTYLTKHQAEIEQVIDQLTTHGAPRWKRSSPEPLWQHPALDQLEQNLSINYQNLRALHRLLLLVSFKQDQQGQSQLANKSLLAAWHLMNSVIDQPLGLSQSMLSNQAEVLRWVNLYSAEWQQRWDHTNPLRLNRGLIAWTLINGQFIKDIPTYALSYDELIKQNEFSKDLPASSIAARFSISRAFLKPFLNPYFTFAAADFVQRTTKFNPQDPCVRSSPDIFRNASDLDEKPVVVWNIAYSLHGGLRWHFTRRISLQWEVTNKILQFRELVAGSQPAPKKIPSFEKSQVCPSVRWNYEVLPDGKVRISSADNKISYTSDGNRFRRTSPSIY